MQLQRLQMSLSDDDYTVLIGYLIQTCHLLNYPLSQAFIGAFSTKVIYCFLHLKEIIFTCICAF